MMLAFGSFALVEGLQLRVVADGDVGGLPEGMAQVIDKSEQGRTIQVCQANGLILQATRNEICSE